MNKNTDLKDEFITVLTHELLTPLVITKGYLSIVLENKNAALDKKTADYLNKAYEGNERLIKIVSEMIRAAEIDRNNLHLTLRPYNIMEILSPLLKTYSSFCGRKGLCLSFSPPKKDSPKIVADLEKTREVIDKLLDNAMKFTDKGEIVINFRQEKIGERQYVTLSVKDSGIGISGKSLGTIFEKFSHANFSLTDQRGGVGLGLYIAKKLIEAQGGILRVESRPGKGSCFSLSLPLAQ